MSQLMLYCSNSANCSDSGTSDTLSPNFNRKRRSFRSSSFFPCPLNNPAGQCPFVRSGPRSFVRCVLSVPLCPSRNHQVMETVTYDF